MTESVKNELSDICRIIDATVDTEKIYLFGSYAYGTPTDDSDYDLCVIYPGKFHASGRRGQGDPPCALFSAVRPLGCNCLSL